MDQKNHQYLKLTPEDLEKVNKTRKKHERSIIDVDEEWYFIASFGKHFGWDGIMAILNNDIDLDTANTLLAAAVKVDSLNLYNSARVSFVAYGSVHTKKPAKTFNDLTKDIVKAMKV